MQLPANIEVSHFIKNYRLQPQLWLQAIRETCLLHAISAEHLIPFPDGSNLIAACDNKYVVKIFPPFHRHQWESEYRVLEHLHEKVTIPIPGLIAHGERDDQWTYLIITLLPGVTLESIWVTCSTEEKKHLLECIGKMMKEVHAVAIGDLVTLQPAWNEFLNHQLKNFAQRHRRLGMPDWFLEGSVTYVQEAISLLPDPHQLVILTGEYTPFNLLVTGAPGQWSISGMIDFGDAMIGYHEYDLLGPLMFLAAGNSALIQSLFKGYGYEGHGTDPDSRRRLLLLQILHRYSNFNDQLRITNWKDRVHNMQELTELILPPPTY